MTPRPPTAAGRHRCPLGLLALSALAAAAVATRTAFGATTGRPVACGVPVRR